MEKRIMIRAGIRKQKGSLLGIGMLMFLTALLLSTVLTVYLGGESYVRREIQRAGFGDLTAWVSNVPEMDALTERIRSQKEIERTEVQNLIFSKYEAGGTESDSEGQMIPWRAGEERYHFFHDNLSGYGEAPQKIASGEVYVSPSMVSIMDIGIGDTITFPVARGGESISLTVAGFYEDPFMGSSMIGMKGFLISEADYEVILQRISQAGMDGLARSGAMVHIFTNSSENISVSFVNRMLNENTSLSQYTEFLHSADAIWGFMVILQNAFCGLLAAFVLILLGAVLVILGHSISSSMEQEYKNLGILKTIGFTGNQLIRIQLIPYILAILIGMLLGLAISFPAAGLMGKMMVTTTGILIPADLPFFPCLAIFAVILLLLAGFTVLKLRKMVVVTLMKAIYGETTEVRRRPGRAVALHARGLPLQLAMRQLLSGKKRYLSACLIAVLLVFIASLAGRMNAWLGPEGKGMMDAFHPADLDMGVQALGELEPQEIENLVRSYTDITDSYLLAMPSVSVEGTNYTANVITEPKRFHISQGETSIKEDEIVLTEAASSDLGVTIGDKVTVRGDMGSREFTVSGIYHCANDMGANIGMNREGYLTIGQDNPNLWCYHYFLSDPSAKTVITEELEAAYGGDVHVHENSWPGLLGIIKAMRLLLVFMYGMIAIFVFIVTIMTGSKILRDEQKDLGIYKAIGCSTGMLRILFSLRFGIVSVIGAVVGTILASFLTDPVVFAVMRLAGISNFASHPTALQILMPGFTVSFLFLGFSYFAARKIRKADMAVLTAET